MSFETPEYTENIEALGTLRILEAIKLFDLGNRTKFYQASTSQLFSDVQEVPQSEKPLSIQGHLTPWQSCTRIGLLSTTGKAMEFMHVTASCFTMSLLGAGKLLLHEKFLVEFQE